MNSQNAKRKNARKQTSPSTALMTHADRGLRTEALRPSTPVPGNVLEIEGMKAESFISEYRPAL